MVTRKVSDPALAGMIAKSVGSGIRRSCCADSPCCSARKAPMPPSSSPLTAHTATSRRLFAGMHGGYQPDFMSTLPRTANGCVGQGRRRTAGYDVGVPGAARSFARLPGGCPMTLVTVVRATSHSGVVRVVGEGCGSSWWS